MQNRCQIFSGFYLRTQPYDAPEKQMSAKKNGPITPQKKSCVRYLDIAFGSIIDPLFILILKTWYSENVEDPAREGAAQRRPARGIPNPFWGPARPYGYH